MKKSLIAIAAAVVLLMPMNIWAQQTEKGSGTAPTPISVERKNIDGVEYVIKTYEVPKETTADSLTEPTFELDGFVFEYESADKKINEKTEEKDASEEETAESASKALEEVIKRFPSTKDYDKDGYKGTLTLDTSSISTQVKGYTTKNYTISATKEYSGLIYADAGFVAQTAVKDGYTLPLTDINWTVMATALSGDSLVPTEYKAVATYAKTFSDKVPTGYVSKALYKGKVTKTTADSVTYRITYSGKKIETGMPKLLKGITFVIVLLLAGGAVWLLILFLKSKNGAEIYNLIDKEYICLGHQWVSRERPVIDLNEFEDMIQSNVFRFVIDKKTAAALFGRNISVTFKDVTVKHRIEEKNKEYRFDLDMGGVLDAQ